jgi:hypothetical protein
MKVCADCGEVKRIKACGVCSMCYKRRHRAGLTKQYKKKPKAEEVVVVATVAPFEPNTIYSEYPLCLLSQQTAEAYRNHRGEAS